MLYVHYFLLLRVLSYLYYKPKGAGSVTWISAKLVYVAALGNYVNKLIIPVSPISTYF